MGRNALATGIIATAAAAVLALSSAPAAAASPPSDGVAQTIAFVGSDTIQDFTAAYLNGLTKNDNTSVYGGWNNDAAANPSHQDTAVNVPARLAASQTVTVPADSACTAPVTYSSTNPPPDGSGAGRDALFAANNRNAGTTSCIDVARSSGGPRVGTDPSGNAVYDQFALDAVSFATFGGAPLNLTLTQIRSIYNCNVTDWSGIAGSGKTGTIHRYLPQAGSGTRSFFIATILGGTFAPNSASCPLDENLQENDATGVAAANQSTAIMAYSAGQWVFQNVGEFHAIDKSAGNWIGTIAGIAPASGDGASASINATAVKDGSFVGSRGLFYVTDNRLAANFTAAARVVGFNQTGVSPLCNGDLASVITDLGFVPLDQQEDGTYCVETVVS